MSMIDGAIICISEAVGTAIFVFLGCMGCAAQLVFSEYGIQYANNEQIALTFGLAVMLSVQIFGHVSGAHINPIVTTAAIIVGNISLLQIPFYIVGQFIGAFAGFGLLLAATPSVLTGHTYNDTYGHVYNRSVAVCSPEINYGYSIGEGFLVEFMISLILVLVYCGAWDKRNKTKRDSVALRFGFAYAILIMAAVNYTGANMNPARSFAPALVNGDWEDHWVYWVAPFTGAILGATLYKFIFSRELTMKSSETEEV